VSILINPFVFAVAATNTLNPSDTAANITLTNGNRTATKSTAAAWASIRAVASKTTGLWYFEFTSAASVTSGGGTAVGVSSGTASLTIAAGDQQSPSDVIVARDGGTIEYNNAASVNDVTHFAWNTGSVTVQIAVDVGSRLFWAKPLNGTALGWNNSGSANPATGTGGISFAGSGAVFPVVGLFSNTTPDAGTINFGQTGFSGSVPSGFSSWN
jgi:hypothetical protein